MRFLKFSRKTLQILLFTLCCAGFTALPPSSPVNKNVAVIFLKHVLTPYCPNQADCEPSWTPEQQALILPPRHSASVYQAILNSLVTDYYNKNSYNQVHLNFTSIINPDSTDGWFDAPHKIFEYNLGDADLYQDGAVTAYAAIGSSLDDYDFLVTVHNYQGRSGQACIAQGPPNFGPAECVYNVGSSSVSFGAVWVSENSDNKLFAAQLSHELGHLLGVPDQYSSPSSTAWPAMGVWDIMGDDRAFNHFSAWSKWNRGWIPAVTDMPCIQGPCDITTELDTLEYAGNNLLRIPFTAGEPFEGYMVECRNQVNHDENIPEAGVLITSIDPWRPIGSSVAQVVSHLGDNDFSTAAMSPGETYVDEEFDITITYVSKSGTDDCTVKATRGEITAPDPWIKQSAPGVSNGYLSYKSLDIWIDSQQNGWGTYSEEEGYHMEGGHVNPNGYGDPFWVDYENRIMFKVRNDGYGPADNVRVDVYVKQPIIISIPGITCRPKEKTAELVGSVVIDHLEAGEIYFGYIPWVPITDSAAQVIVDIEDYIGEITHSNNMAKESYASQSSAVQVSQQSNAVGAVTPNFGLETIKIEAGENCLTGIPFFLYPIKIDAIVRRDWVMQISQLQGIAQPGKETEVEIMNIPPADAQPGDCEEMTIKVIALVGDTFMPVDGVTYRSCVVETSKITCSTASEPIKQGMEATVIGELTPNVSGGSIALEFTNPSGEVFIENANIDKAGAYEHQFLPEETGKWKVQTFWQGDDKTSPAKSEICYFTLESNTPQFTLNHNVNCRSGPGMEYPVITSGRIGDVIEIEARSPDAKWLYGKIKNSKCWMSLELGKLNVNPWTLPVRQPPPKPIKSSCRLYDSEALCLRHKDECKWVYDAAGLGKCTSR